MFRLEIYIIVSFMYRDVKSGEFDRLGVVGGIYSLNMHKYSQLDAYIRLTQRKDKYVYIALNTRIGLQNSLKHI